MSVSGCPMPAVTPLEEMFYLAPFWLLVHVLTSGVQVFVFGRAERSVVVRSILRILCLAASQARAKARAKYTYEYSCL